MQRKSITAAAFVILSCTVPAYAQTCTPFTDLPASSAFCANVQWMFNRGITLGCTATQYCPDLAVTRLQMAAFMNRLGSVMFEQGGSAFDAPAILGTRDAQPLDIRVDDRRAMRYEPNPTSPNVIGGSPANAVTAGVRGATIAGGGVPPGESDPFYDLEAPNRVTDHYGTVGGGFGNQAGDNDSVPTSSGFATVGGGIGNSASGSGSAIAGGAMNQATGPDSFVGGGLANTASGWVGTVGGGQDNLASHTRSTVAGGRGNVASGEGSAIGGGVSNAASGLGSTVAGGSLNSAGDEYSTVAGGRENTASESYSVVAGGLLNAANGIRSAVGGGSGNVAGGFASTIPGGSGNRATGASSFAAGANANAATAGAFVWSDARGFLFSATAENTFNVRSTGGISLVAAINASTGAPTQFCNLSPGVVGWQCFSDRNSKENFEPAATANILERLVAMPLSSWTVRGVDDAPRMLGPTAQDFHEAFDLGGDRNAVSMLNLSGVALAAIKGLNAKLEARLAEREAEAMLMRAELAEMRSVREELAAIREMLARRAPAASEPPR